MRRNNSRLPTLRGLDPSSSDQYQNRELQGLQINFLYSQCPQNLADSQSWVPRLTAYKDNLLQNFESEQGLIVTQHPCPYLKPL